MPTVFYVEKAQSGAPGALDLTNDFTKDFFLRILLRTLRRI